MSPMNDAVAHHRARHTALKRYRADDDPQVVAARRDLKAASMAQQIERFKDYLDREIASAPPLTAQQRATLAELLEPVRIKPPVSQRTKPRRGAA